MSEIAIIKLDPARWPEARQLRLEALQQAPDAFLASYEEEVQFDDEVWQRRAKDGSAADGNIVTLYAQTNNQLVGMMVLSASDRPKILHVAHLYSVYVRKTMRGKGVASRLLEAILAEVALRPKIEKLSLTVNAQNEAAIALYEKFGFTKVGLARKAMRIGAQYYDECLMENHL